MRLGHRTRPAGARGPGARASRASQLGLASTQFERAASLPQPAGPSEAAHLPRLVVPHAGLDRLRQSRSNVLVRVVANRLTRSNRSMKICQAVRRRTTCRSARLSPAPIATPNPIDASVVHSARAHPSFFRPPPGPRSRAARTGGPHSVRMIPLPERPGVQGRRRRREHAALFFRGPRRAAPSPKERLPPIASGPSGRR